LRKKEFILKAHVVDQFQDNYNRKLVTTECNYKMLVNVHIGVKDESVNSNFVSQNVHSDEVESVMTDEDSDSEAVCIPEGRQSEVLRMAHNTAHWSARNTKECIIISGMTWPTVASDLSRYATSGEVCQKRVRKTCYDHVKIAAIPRDTEPFRHWFLDCAESLLPGQNIYHNYALILVDSATRYPVCYPLRSLSAKNVCDELVSLFMMTGIASGMILSRDSGSNFIQL